MFRILLSSAFLICAGLAQAADPVVVSHAWARATAPGQDVGAAYMQLKSSSDLTLNKAESPAAESVEIHSMTMKDGVMEMRMLEKLALPAGKLVKLEPGGFHFMLFDLKRPLKAGEKVSLILYFKDAAGKLSSMKVEIPVKKGQD
jgi:copper(I)-binding protein